jgi:hypothetical protein
VLVDLVLDQGGGCASAAKADLATLDQHNVNALLYEPMGHQGSADAAPDDGDIAAAVLGETWISGEQPIVHDPERCPGGEIHWSRGWAGS